MIPKQLRFSDLKELIATTSAILHTRRACLAVLPNRGFKLVGPPPCAARARMKASGSTASSSASSAILETW
jgi:hypothetical protein